MQASGTSALYDCCNKLNLADSRAISIVQLFRELNFEFQKCQFSDLNKRIYDLPQPIYVIGENGDELVEQVFYNGLSTIYKIIFEDNSEYGFTGDHKLLAHYPSREDDFIKVRNLSEGDEIVHLTHIRNNNEEIIQTIQSYLKVDKIEVIKPLHQTWEIITESNTYVLPNGCVSLNGLLS